MKEIVTGACLLAIAFISISALHAAVKAEVGPRPVEVAAHRATVIIFSFLAIAAGFSGCGIFIRGVIR